MNIRILVVVVAIAAISAFGAEKAWANVHGGVGATSTATSAGLQGNLPAPDPKKGKASDAYVDKKTGDVMVRLNRGDAAESIMEFVEELCASDKDEMELNDGGQPLTIYELTIDRKKKLLTFGGVTIAFECEVPAPQGMIPAQIHAQWKALAHGAGEFTNADLKTVLEAVGDGTEPDILKPHDKPRGYWGEDLQYVNKAFANSTTGQFKGWVVQGETVVYLIVTSHCLEICTGDVVVWHLHPPKKVDEEIVHEPWVAPAPKPEPKNDRLSIILGQAPQGCGICPDN